MQDSMKTRGAQCTSPRWGQGDEQAHIEDSIQSGEFEGAETMHKRYIRLNLQEAQDFLNARHYELHPDKLKEAIHQLPLLSGNYPIQVPSNIISPLPMMSMIPQEGLEIGFFTDRPQWDTKRRKWTLTLESSPRTFHSDYQIVLRMQ